MSALQDILSLVPTHNRDKALSLVAQIGNFNNDRERLFESFRKHELLTIELLACYAWGCTIEELYSNKRNQECLYSRQFMYDYLYNTMRWSYERVGKHYRKNHATVLNGMRAFGNLIETDKHFRAKFAEFKNQISLLNDKPSTTTFEIGNDSRTTQTDVLIHRTVNH